MTATLSAPTLAATWRAEFPVFTTTTYLNSCSLGALSRRSRARINEHLDLWETRGASAWYEIWWGALSDLRAGYGRLVGAPASAIALHPSATSALVAVGEALDYSTRRKIITTSLDFPTVPYQWMVKQHEGVEVVVLESPDGISVPLQMFEDAIDEHTALVATSHVYFTSGAIQDAAGVAKLAHAKGALCLIDGYQGAGQVPVDVTAMDCDFYISGGLKWLLGGTGVAFLYARESLLPMLAPSATGWFSHKEQFRFDPRSYTPHDDARRLEMGTPALPSVYAQLGGLEIIEAIGVPRIREETMALTEDLIAGALAAGLKPRMAPDAADRTAIVMLPSDDPHADVRRLAAAGIIVDARPGHVRVSPYFYNLMDDHRAMLARFTEAR